MKRTDIAYAAGLMDGEAYIGIKKSQAYKCQGRKTPGYHARIQIRMVDEAAIKFIAELLGGWYYKEKAHSVKGRPLYCYQCSDLKAEQVLKKLLPFLKVKKPTTEVVLSLRALQARGKRFRTKVTGYRIFPNRYGTKRRVPNLSFSDDYVDACDNLYQRCKLLNKVGI